MHVIDNDIFVAIMEKLEPADLEVAEHEGHETEDGVPSQEPKLKVVGCGLELFQGKSYMPGCFPAL
jgi:hypothetical protein